MAVQKYGSKQRLLNNQRYNVTFQLKGETKEFSFTSKYAPMYSTIRIIRNDFPDQFADISDDTINFALWQNSLMVEDLMDQSDISTDNLDPTIAFARKQYVRYKTEYDIVRSLVVNQTSSAGEARKELGEFKISKASTIFDPGPILKVLQGELTRWESALGTSARVRGATRAVTKFPYPLNARVSF